MKTSVISEVTPRVSDMKNKQFGLLGRKLTHSYSPQIHALLGDYDYVLAEKEPEDVSAFVKDSTLAGFNVTIPYKKTVYELCDELSETAQKLRNVNTVIRLPDGRLYGHNTDYYGFMYMLKKSKVVVSNKKVLVLGSGGASATVCVVLKDCGAKEIVVISRTGENNYENLYLHKDADVIINTTPVGMYPNNGKSPVDLKVFPKLSGVLDLIYNPCKTALLYQAEQLKLPCCNGLSMLVAQAKESAEYFLETAIPEEKNESVIATMESKMQNIILIGMPGCGKTTLGKLLAENTGRPFYDSDEWIETQHGHSPADIIRTQGEEAFRAIETQALEELCKQSGGIIATGGGCVTRPENELLLRQNGIVFWVMRSITALSTQGRPLSQQNDLQQLYAARKPFYEQFSDCRVTMDESPETTANKIMEMYYETTCH